MYKSTIGSAACTSCALNSGTVGVTASTAVTACKCDAGYSGPDGGTCTGITTLAPLLSLVNFEFPRFCVACAVGSYKSSSGSATCTTCNPNFSTVSTGSTAITSCICNAGYTG